MPPARLRAPLPLLARPSREAVAVANSTATTLADLGHQRVLFALTAYNRKQHVHMKQMILSVVNMCEVGEGWMLGWSAGRLVG